ncbi:uncharacterized protein LOC125049388 [Pieris napi]|uniref:uncharacterized protein LOC125049388 n=1 Tax=Pieris napi TaxID=78633 RepID=UPI001FBABA83|nr:uncharacterized protein LOC125049388 [Pieris napi]XP_047504582.1 uncharacterized protein LOC125049388 [Pieris napi]
MMEDKMDEKVQCPVCTLYLHNGMSLETHLDTHPKDQVIKALCCLSSKGNASGSRTPTPSISEHSYRSRTPVTDDSVRWSTSRRSAESTYWRRTPSRNKSLSSCNSRNDTPEARMNVTNFDSNAVNPCSEFSNCSVKSSKTSQSYLPSVPTIQSNYSQQYPFYSEPTEDPEIKYSRSSDYNVGENTNQLFVYNVPVLTPNVKVSTSPTLPIPSTSKKQSDYVKILPKQNMVLKNAARLGYISPGIKPYPVMMSTSPTYMQKNVQANMMVTGSGPVSGILDTKTAVAPLASQFTQLNSGNLTTGTTVVTQNSQIIYREMVHSIDGKPYISNIPHVLNTHENMGQSGSLYQNLMVVDPFGNTSCIYSTPQSILPKTCNSPIFSNSLAHIPTSIDKSIPNIVNDVSKTLIMEVSPIQHQMSSKTEVMAMQQVEETMVSNCTPGQTESDTVHRALEPESDSKNSTVSTKGLKILSNIKVEVPVQHNKNMINTIMDLTGPGDSGYIQCPRSPENILPDLKEKPQSTSDIDNHCQPSNESNVKLTPHNFSVIKNVGNPQSCKDFPKLNSAQEDNESCDSNPVPDLICNEKPSISPCSDLLENSMDQCSQPSKHDHSPESKKGIFSTDQKLKTEVAANQAHLERDDSKTSKSLATLPVVQALTNIVVENDDFHSKQKSHPLRLNNIFVKKHKKLTIKNFKPLRFNSDPQPSSSTSKSEPYFNLNIEKEEKDHDDGIQPETSVQKIEVLENEKEFDADTEEQSMDIEPTAPSMISHSNGYSSSIDLVIKEEVNSNNEFSNEADRSGRDLATLESLRPINVITYGNMGAADFDDDSNHRELLDLETASKNKQFVNMMNDNYFGDNIYADYFTPDRVESFDSEKGSNVGKDREVYNIWGEPSQKENEFVLPNFIHESYKIAESNMEYDIGENQNIDHIGHAERDSKADVLQETREEEPPLNICADERMPPRGELSGQESNGDMESSWSGMYPEVTAAEPYDLMARESWVSDGSDVDDNHKTENLEEPSPKGRLHTCAQCGLKFPTLKELRSHCNASYSHSRIARCIKREEKPDVPSLAETLIFETKDAVATSILPEFDPLAETKPELILIKQKKKRNNFVCITCNVDQGGPEAFNEHLKVHPLECYTCGKFFYRRANLVLHTKTHLGIKNYKCEVCGKRFVTRQKLGEHRNTHTGQAPVKCTLCDQTFRRYSNMVQHRDRHHLKKKAKVRDFVCRCGAFFHSRAKLLWHQETHEERPKACPYCGDKFVHAASLTRHVRRSHNHLYVARRSGRDENVPCPVCKQVYLRSNLRAHLHTHSGKRPFVCVTCDKAFTTKWNLKLHRWTHASRSSKPYKCTLCKGAFFRQSEYAAHVNAHRSVRPYTCKHCGRQFIRKYNCQRHVREHETAKRYACEVPDCGKTFHRSYYLTEHMRVHSGARPFACNVCGKTSTNKSNHNKHVKIHHAREPIATEA